MNPEDAAEVARLKAAMLKKVFYVMTRQAVAPERAADVLLDHYRWIIGLEKEGKVLLSGPLTERGGAPGAGMTVFRASSFEEAEALAAGDPFCSSGAFAFAVRAWQVNEGRVSLSVDFSDQTFCFG